MHIKQDPDSYCIGWNTGETSKENKSGIYTIGTLECEKKYIVIKHDPAYCYKKTISDQVANNSMSWSVFINFYGTDNTSQH